jgi:hypothetical protein
VVRKVIPDPLVLSFGATAQTLTLSGTTVDVTRLSIGSRGYLALDGTAVGTIPNTGFQVNSSGTLDLRVSGGTRANFSGGAPFVTLAGGRLLVNNANVTLGDGIKLAVDAAGGNAVAGTATLVAGAVTVNTTSVGASSLIILTRNTPGGTVGDLSAPGASIVAGTSFDIDSASGTDTSTVNWWILN